MLEITSVEPGGLAAAMGLEPGDCLLRINEQPIDDLVDYHRAVESVQLTLEILRRDQDLWELTLDKQPDEALDLDVVHPTPRQCGNQCLFCFVHQLPKGLRRSLYLKDEDYRFSFLYGSYITLTNLTEDDLERIVRQRLSPLYISVHATDPDLRRKLLGTEVPEILPILEQLVQAGIELHCQIVLCPDVNDGKELVRTLEDLASLCRGIASLAVVPVGLTRFRQHLPYLKPLDQPSAEACLDQVHGFQQRMLTQQQRRFVYAADEIYLRAGRQLPPREAYDDLPQLENGVGLIAAFRSATHDVLHEAEPLTLRRVTLVTGALFSPELKTFALCLADKINVELPVVAIVNDFFGKQITVAGLLTGNDLLKQLEGRDLGDAVLLPAVMFRDGADLLLDDMTVAQLEKQLQVPVMVVEESPWGLLAGLEALAAPEVEVIQC